MRISWPASVRVASFTLSKPRMEVISIFSEDRYCLLLFRQRRTTASATPPDVPKITPAPEPSPRGMSGARSTSASKSMPASSIISMSS